MMACCMCYLDLLLSHKKKHCQSWNLSEYRSGSVHATGHPGQITLHTACMSVLNALVNRYGHVETDS